MSETDRPEAPRLRDFQDGKNPFGNGKELATVTMQGLISVEQQKAIAEVQARMIMARQMPRDPLRAADAIIRDCTRVSLAEKALYSYARGGQDITGPSIRLAEAVAQKWGNIAAGIKELSRANGYSECVAYAWDLESGYYDERQFQVRHWRDTRAGGHPIKEERDIYELVANMGQRRKRAVLLAVIPGDVIEMAVQECEQTLHANADTSPEAILKLQDAFDRFHVTKAQIEKRIQRKLESIRPAQVVQLRKIYASLLDEMSTPEEWFEAEAGGTWGAVEAAHAAARPTTAPPAQTRSAPRKAPAKAPAEAQAKTPPIDDEIPTGRWEDEAAQRAPSPESTQTAPQEQPASREQPAAQAPEVRRNEPASGVQAFEAWLLDVNGDPATDDPYADPMTFAVALAGLVKDQPEMVETILEQNADGIQDAKATGDIVAANVLESLAPPFDVGDRNLMSDADEAETPGVILIPLKMERGKPVTGEYLKAFKAEMPNIVAANWADFIELNRAEMAKVPKSTISLCLKDLRKRAQEIGVEYAAELETSLLTSSPAPVAANGLAPADRSWLDHRLKQIGELQHLDELEILEGSSAVAQFLARAGEHGGELKAAFATRRRALGA